MPIIYANNINIYYEIHGEGEPLLLITGFGWHSAAWQHQLHDFSKHYKVILIDNRGSGQTEAPEGAYTTELMARDTLALMEALNISSVNVVGHSMGSAIAQEMTFLEPNKIKNLVLQGTFVKLSQRTIYALKLAKKLAEDNLSIETRARIMLPWGFGSKFLGNKINTELAVRWAATDPYKQKKHAYFQQIAACINHDFSNRLHYIKMPTLVISGIEDILTPLAEAQVIAENISDAEIAVVKNAAHNCNIENPVEFNKIVLNFLMQKSKG